MRAHDQDLVLPFHQPPIEGEEVRVPDDNAVVTLREYVDAVFARQDRAVGVAEQEREKAANALRIEIARAIGEGDQALRDHMEAQLAAVRLALTSAGTLETERITGLRQTLEAMNALTAQRLDGLQREVALHNAASEQAIAKAEAATEKRFEGVNEWRDQSADRERSYQDQAAALTAQFPRREVVDAQLNELRASVLELREKLSRVVE